MAHGWPTGRGFWPPLVAEEPEYQADVQIVSSVRIARMVVQFAEKCQRVRTCRSLVALFSDRRSAVSTSQGPKRRNGRDHRAFEHTPGSVGAKRSARKEAKGAEPSASMADVLQLCPVCLAPVVQDQ